MKFSTLTVSALCIVAANASNLHIIKLKHKGASNINQTATFEPGSFIREHYALYQTTHQNAGVKAMASTASPSLDTIQLGQDFSAVVGSFDTSFTQYLDKIEAIDYIEPNQVYRVAAVAGKRDRQVQSPVPNWGIARITHRAKDDLSSNVYDDTIQGYAICCVGNYSILMCCCYSDGIHVYVFDTGINVDHPDIKGRVTRDANFIDYEDDNDESGHGTHVAGIIGGTTFGVAKKAQIHSIKILDKQGDGSTVSLLKAISFVSSVAKEGKSIINLSLSGPRSQLIDDALSSVAQNHNIPIFVAAGNTGDDACQYTPSANPSVFAVGASDNTDTVPAFSSFGSCVRLYAPGVGITSSWLGTETHSLDGTSMANPHVAGIAALLLGKNNFSSVEQVYDRLTSIATKNALKMSPAAEMQENHNLLAYTGIEATP
ncbi:peptidase S8/S53 domain-containing protein [Fennellomyces sp. T-0311]|nr:peptidase S8/S53 domain-containing protein [Fennellomyces sp. T-0311]